MHFEGFGWGLSFFGQLLAVMHVYETQKLNRSKLCKEVFVFKSGMCLLTVTLLTSRCPRPETVRVMAV